MKSTRWVSALFWVAAVYDGFLGIVFLFSAPEIFVLADVVPPNHFGYVHFPAALLLVFAVMFAEIALRPTERRGLIPYGILLKVAYVGVVGWHWVATDIPGMWKPFALADAVFAVLFALAFVALKGAMSANVQGESGAA